MARRIDIELTSARPDGTWTWRAAGARQPRGVLDAGLLYAGAKAGDVVRADADFEIDGIVIVAVAPPKEKERPEPERLEILGPTRGPVSGVTTQLAGRSDRRPSGRRREATESRPSRPSGPERPRSGMAGPRSQDRPGRPSGGRAPGATEGPAGRVRKVDAGEGRRAHQAQPSPDAGRPDGTASRSGTDRPAGRRERARSRPEARPADQHPGTGREPARARRLNPANTHREAVLDALAPEERPVAEQVLRGGIPAVRTALHLEREKAAAEGRPAPNADALLAMAEQLLPRLKSAEWRDRAEAADKAADDISLRDLRAVVAGGDLARDDETRALAAALRDRLEQRLAKLQADWEQEISRHLDDNRVVRALRLAARPPDPSARLSADLTARLAEATGQAMTPETVPERWAALLEAVAASPVRRAVKPVGLPTDAPPEVVRAAQQQAGRIPALAALLGIAIPPPPGPRPVEPARRRSS